MIERMFIDRAGIPFVLIAVVLAGLAAWSGGRGWALPFLVLAAFFVFFFRDPDRTTPSEPNLVVSPADGRVMLAGVEPGPGAPDGQWRQISIFLSPIDVHVNRTPVEGTVTHVEYHPGKFLPAYKVEAGQLNEWTEVWFERQGRAVVCRQIVGILARRIVCRLRTGDTVTRGQRFGVMKFGSRIDLFVPTDARILVKAGDRVVAGETVLAQVP
jgi:phosphatidylserine decarboxylase